MPLYPIQHHFVPGAIFLNEPTVLLREYRPMKNSVTITGIPKNIMKRI